MRGVTADICMAALATTISTHTPHARRDLSFILLLAQGEFLLTRLMRGVTAALVDLGANSNNFYSHASCEA